MDTGIIENINFSELVNKNKTREISNIALIMEKNIVIYMHTYEQNYCSLLELKKKLYDNNKKNSNGKVILDLFILKTEIYKKNFFILLEKKQKELRIFKKLIESDLRKEEKLNLIENKFSKINESVKRIYKIDQYNLKDVFDKYLLTTSPYKAELNKRNFEKNPLELINKLEKIFHHQIYYLTDDENLSLEIDEKIKNECNNLEEYKKFKEIFIIKNKDKFSEKPLETFETYYFNSCFFTNLSGFYGI